MARHFKTKHRVLYTKILPLIKKPYVEPVKLRTSSTWVKKYSTEVGENRHKCDLCENILKMPKAHGNFKRHIRLKHPEIYQVETEFEARAEKEEGAQNMEPEYDVEYIEEALESEDGVVEEHIEDLKENAKNAPDVETSGSPVPEAIEYQDVGNLDSQPELKDYGDIEHIFENDPELEDKIKWLAQRVVPGKRGNALTCVWNFFKAVEANQAYTCIFCYKEIRIFPFSCSNLKRHLATKHKKQFKLLVKYAPEFKKKGVASLTKLLEQSNRSNDVTKSFEASYFEGQGESRFKCRSCDEVIECKDSNSLVLFKHIHDKHGEEVISQLKDNVDDDEEFSVLFVKKKDLELL
ncbi:unnamed protein product, partial [Iphiclides podalirius]